MKLIDALENIRRKHRSRLEKWHADDGEWVTIKGTHVEIDDETGAITKGPERLKTMNKPERGLASAGKKVLARTKESMKSLEGDLKAKKGEYSAWIYRKRGLEYDVDLAKDRVEMRKKSLEKQKSVVSERYPEGMDFYKEKAKRLEQEAQEMASLLYGDEHKEERRAMGSEKRDSLDMAYNEKLQELEASHVALGAYKTLDSCEQAYEIAKLEQKEAEGELSALMADDSMAKYHEKITEYDELAERRNKALLKVFPNADACETSSDVTEYLRAKDYFKKKDEHAIDADTRVNLYSMDPESARACARRLDQFMTDYPALKGEFGGIDCHDMSNEPGHENAYAYCRSRTDKMVCYNEKRFKPGGDAMEKWDIDTVTRWSPPGTDPSSLIDHEYTHALEKLIKEKRGKSTNVANLVMKRAMIAVDGEYNKEREQEIREALCRYAGDNRGVKRSADGRVVENPDYGRNTEFIAEAMAEARNSPNPRPYAVAVRKEMEKLMKEVGLL